MEVREMSAKERSGRRATGGMKEESGAPPCFDCNICLGPAAEPMVTLCGHLYCRSCVRGWLRSDQPCAKQCPVCKASASEDRLVPLYGRGIATDAATCDDDVCFDIQPIHSSGDQQRRYGQYGGRDYRSWASVFHSNAGCVIGSVAVAVLPWAFPGGQLQPPSAFRYSARRQRRVEHSLHQILLFFTVLTVLCFLLF